VQLAGELATPAWPVGMVVFAHGTGSGRHSPRDRQLARTLNQSRLATVLVDLLTPAEEPDRTKVFDIALLANRLAGVTRWLQGQPEGHRLPVGFFGASTGAAAALWAAAHLGDQIGAVVSRGGRADRPAACGPRNLEVGTAWRSDWGWRLKTPHLYFQFAPSEWWLAHVSEAYQYGGYTWAGWSWAPGSACSPTGPWRRTATGPHG
jgi:dienelactone hydrolase